jgi:hypothetical protein
MILFFFIYDGTCSTLVVSNIQCHNHEGAATTSFPLISTTKHTMPQPRRSTTSFPIISTTYSVCCTGGSFGVDVPVSTPLHKSSSASRPEEKLVSCASWSQLFWRHLTFVYSSILLFVSADSGIFIYLDSLNDVLLIDQKG